MSCIFHGLYLFWLHSFASDVYTCTLYIYAFPCMHALLCRWYTQSCTMSCIIREYTEPKVIMHFFVCLGILCNALLEWGRHYIYYACAVAVGYLQLRMLIIMYKTGLSGPSYGQCMAIWDITLALWVFETDPSLRFCESSCSSPSSALNFSQSRWDFSCVCAQRDEWQWWVNDW